jgi:hypothetical protein
LQRDWWLRTLLVLQQPRAVFTALRAGGEEEEARAEPVLALVLLVGIAGMLATDVAGRLLDDAAIDAVLVPVWAFVGGGIYGVVAYFGLGALVYLGSRAAGSRWGYRRARHVLAFAGAPVALTLLVWPVLIAAFGEDVFRTGGSDESLASTAFDVVVLAMVVWSCALLVLGLRALNDWAWPRALLSALPALAVLVAAYVLL